MKKIILAMIAVLAAVFAVLAVLGSGGEYSAERVYYQAMKVNHKIVSNPDVAPAALLLSVENGLHRVIADYPKTNIAKEACMSLVEFYAAHKDYGKAISAASDAMAKYPDDEALMSTAYFMKGVIYERQDKWDKSLAEFLTLRENYSDTRIGIQTPIYIGNYYGSKGLDREARDAYQDAAAFYKQKQKEYPGKMLGYSASVLLIQAYFGLKDYESAGKAVEDTLHNYATGISFIQLLPLVENIYVKQLNDAKKAIEIYKYVISKTKDKRLIKFLDEKIKALESGTPVS